MYSYYQLKRLPSILKFSKRSLARNVVSVNKLKTVSAPLRPTLAVWPFGYLKDDNQKTEPTEENIKTKDPSLWKLFSFDKLTFSSDGKNSSPSSNGDKSKSWLETFFETDDKSEKEAGMLEYVSAATMTLGFLLFWVANGHLLEKVGENELFIICSWLLMYDLLFGEVKMSDAVHWPGYREDKGVICRLATVF